MLFRKIIIVGTTFAMLGVTSCYAVPAKKMSTVRAGQLEAEYRKATQPRKDQIIEELTAAGFGHIVQRIIERDEPSKQQVRQKPTQAAKKMSTVRAGQLETEYRKATQPRKDQIIEELTAAGFGHIAQRIAKRDEPSKQQVRQKPTQVAAVAQPIVPQPAPEKQVEPSEAQRIEQRRQEIISLIEKAIANAQNAKNLDLKSVEAALTEIAGEPLHRAVSTLEEKDRKIYQERLQQEKNLLEQRKNDLLLYSQQLQDLEREIGFIVDSAKTVSEVDAMHKKIDVLQARQKELYADEYDIKKLREQLEQKKRWFLEEQKKERKEIDAKVNQAIENVKNAESLDQINQAISELRGEQLRAVFSKLESEDQKIYQDRLNKEVALLEKKKQDLLNKQTEKEKAEQARKAQEELAKQKAAQDAALKAEQEEKRQQALELEKKKNNLIQDIKNVIEGADKAKTMQEIKESRGQIQVYLQGELATRVLLTDVEKKELDLQLRKALEEITKKRANLIVEEKIIAKMQVIKKEIAEATTASLIRPILDKIGALEQEIIRSGIERVRSAQLTQELGELKKGLQQEMQSLQQKKKEEDENLANAQKALKNIATKVQNAKTEQEIVHAQQELEAFVASLTEKSKQIFKNVIDEQSRILLQKKKKIEELTSSKGKIVKVDVTVPQFHTNDMFTYNDVSIITDENGSIINVQHNGRNIDLTGFDDTKDVTLWIGSQIFVDDKINQVKEDLGIGNVQAPVSPLAISDQVRKMINLIPKSPLVQASSTKQHDYFYNYVKPAVERKLKKLEGIVTQ